MRRSLLLAAVLLLLATGAPPAAAALPASSHARVGTQVKTANAGQAVTPVQIYGAWHCGNDYCTWGAVRSIAEFDSQNHWLIDRGDGRPSVNMVILSFVNPLSLLHQTTDAATLNGVPRGMTPEIVNYFTSRGIRVMLSIGGITYTDDWDAALAENPTLFGQRAAAVASQLGVGIEIDYEQNTDPNLTALQSFIDAYRAINPYDATGTRPQARLTIDVAAGDRCSQIHRRDLHRVRRQGPTRMHRLQHLGTAGHRPLRADCCAQRCWYNSRHARLHVLGRRATLYPGHRNRAPVHLRRRCRCGSHRADHPGANAGTPTELNG